MADDRPGITPADDPYEFDWPDDAKDERAAQREEKAKTSTVRPAPLLLSALTIGTGTVLAFILPVAIVAGAISFFVATVAPVVIGGLVVALLPAVLLERVSRGWRNGFAQVAFIALGLLVGAGWTWLVMTLFDAAPPDRVRAATFMATAVGAAFYAAYTWAEPFRRYRRYVFTLASVIGFLTLASIGNYLLFVFG